MRDSRDRPDHLAAPPQALLLRWLSAHPGQTFTLLGAPRPATVFRTLTSSLSTAITKRWFALSLGADQSAAERWIRGSSPHPATRRALAVLDSNGADGVADRWIEWCSYARLEARLRGLGDLEQRSSWKRERQRQEVKGAS